MYEKIIKTLIDEIDSLNKHEENKRKEYNDITEIINNIKNNNNDMNEKLSKINLVINNTVENKFFNIVLFLFAGGFVGIFLWLNISSKNHMDLIMKIFSSFIGSVPIFMTGAILEKVCKNQITKYFIEKYPNLKTLYNEKIDLEKSITINNNKLDDLIYEKRRLFIIITEIRDNIWLKNQELCKIEKERIINDNTENVKLNDLNQSKKRIRIPEDKL